MARKMHARTRATVRYGSFSVAGVVAKVHDGQVREGCAGWTGRERGRNGERGEGRRERGRGEEWRERQRGKDRKREREREREREQVVETREQVQAAHLRAPQAPILALYLYIGHLP